MWLTMRMRYIVSVCLDAFALLAWLQDEPGAEITEGFLSQAASSQDFHCFVSAINVGEVYYRLYRVRGAAEAETFWEEAWQGLVPLTIITPTPHQLHQAAQLKGRYLIAYADAFAAQLAQEKHLPLASGDPELQALEAAGELTLIWLPR
jgi:predicted nucleic acid-binding protein